MLKKIIFLLIVLTTISFGGWEKLKSNTSEWLTDIFFVDDYYGFAVGTNSTILKTTDGGNNWQNLSNTPTEWYTSVYFLNKNKGFIVGTNGIVTTTEDGGSNWKSTYLPYQANFHEVFFIDESNGWITGGNIFGGSVILKTTNGGKDWLPVINGFGLEFLGLKFNSTNSGYVVGRSGTLLKSVDGGNNWYLNVISSYELEDVSFAGSDIWVTGDHGTFLKSTNNGLSWYTFAKISDDHLFKVRFIDKNLGIIVGGSGSGYSSESSIILETSNGGGTWTLTRIAYWPKLYSVAYPSKNRAYAAGFNGTILRYDSTITSVKKDVVPTDFILAQNYPNPFNPETVISYKLPYSSHVLIKIYDMLGRETATLVNQFQNAGEYNYQFSAENLHLTSGVYLYSLEAGENKLTKKMILTK